MIWNYTHSEELYHHGIKGMKWGVRRYQNKDGTLTAAGRKRAAKSSYKLAKKEAGNKWGDKETKIDDKDYRARKEYYKGRTSRIQYEESKAKSVKSKAANYQNWQNERAEAKRDYKLAIGKDEAKVNKKYEKAKQRNANRAQREWDSYVEKLVSEKPKMASSLAEMGTIKYSELTKAHEKVQRGLELQKTRSEVRISSLEAQNSKNSNRISDLERENERLRRELESKNESW